MDIDTHLWDFVYVKQTNKTKQTKKNTSCPKMKCACYRYLDLLMFTRLNVYIRLKISVPDGCVMNTVARLCPVDSRQLLERLAVLLLSSFSLCKVSSVVKIKLMNFKRLVASLA